MVPRDKRSKGRGNRMIMKETRCRTTEKRMKRLGVVAGYEISC